MVAALAKIRESKHTTRHQPDLVELEATKKSLEAKIKDLSNQLRAVEQQITELNCPLKVGDNVLFLKAADRDIYKFASIPTCYAKPGKLYQVVSISPVSWYYRELRYSIEIRQVLKDGSLSRRRGSSATIHYGDKWKTIESTHCSTREHFDRWLEGKG